MASGSTRAELSLAVSRHATSKLASAEDLLHIATLGFRGEALASVGSVSRLTITTCQPDVKIGARLVVDGGKVLPVEQFGAATGTVVKVENLFYNVPARLKFLKQDATERQQINGLGDTLCAGISVGAFQADDGGYAGTPDQRLWGPK